MARSTTDMRSGPADADPRPSLASPTPADAVPPARDPRALIDAAVANHRRRQAANAPQAGPPTDPASPSPWLLVFGTVLPVLVILIEGLTGMCATAFFDPMPTPAHAAVLAIVPAANLAAWLVLTGRLSARPRALAFATGAASAIATFYAVLFLPVLPFAVLGLIAFVGILPLSPLLAAIATVKLRRRQTVHEGDSRRTRAPFVGGIVAALAALIAIDVPQTVTTYALKLTQSPSAQDRARGIDLLRRFTDPDDLARLAWGASRRPLGPAALLIALVEDGGHDPLSLRPPFVSPQHVAEVYYRVTGRPLQSADASLQHRPLFGMRAQQALWSFDPNVGGQSVGAKVPGLTLASSRIDASINPDDALAYLEWQLEVRNDSALAREARLMLALPPGGVVSRVTLWVNGVEEEAAYAAKGQVRAAYERVVRRAQDPFLVTTKGADRVLAQAFPVPANGGTMRFKVGITAPLDLTSLTEGRLVLPAIIERNLEVADGVRHAVWVESRAGVSGGGDDLVASSLPGGGTRLTGEIADRGGVRPVLTVTRTPAPRTTMARLPGEAIASQEIRAATRRADDALMIVLDGSARVAPHINAIIRALDDIPSGFPVGLAVAGPTPVTLPPKPWSPGHKANITAAVRSAGFAGGEDNAPALAAAFAALGGAERGRVLWVHGPQPVAFAASKTRMEQAGERQRRTPAVSLYALEDGPNALIADAPWSWGATDVPRTGSVSGDLGSVFKRASGLAPAIEVKRTLSHVTQAGDALDAAQSASGFGSGHIARLAANDAVLAMVMRDPVRARDEAARIAAAHQLVTPVSGAVVLETAQQYVDAGLKPVTAQTGKVPTVPEPHEWALIVASLAALAWLLLGAPRRRVAFA